MKICDICRKPDSYMGEMELKTGPILSNDCCRTVYFDVCRDCFNKVVEHIRGTQSSIWEEKNDENDS